MVDKPYLMVCNVCGKQFRIRKDNGFGCFPVAHVNNDSKEPCHGFFEEGFKVKNG